MDRDMPRSVTWDDIYCMDCLLALNSIPDSSVDLVFADPPFNIGRRDYPDRRKDYHEWCSSWISESFRVLKPTGLMFLMTITRHLDWTLPLLANHGKMVNLIVWWNVSGQHSKRNWWNAYQPIAVYAKTDNYTFNLYAEPGDVLVPWDKQRTTPGAMKDVWQDIPFIYSGSIVHKEAILTPGTRSKAHSCQMPLKLGYRILRFGSNPGDKVIDLFSGSGSFCVAAKELGRKFLGFDIIDKFVILGRDRLANTGKINVDQRTNASPTLFG